MALNRTLLAQPQILKLNFLRGYEMLVPFTKNGKWLQGTLERLRGVALVEGKGDDGELVYTH